MPIGLLSYTVVLCFVLFSLWCLVFTKADFSRCKDVQPIANAWEGCIRFSSSKPAEINQKRQVRYFLQLSDLHMDKEYTQGASEDSSCHRSPKPSQNIKVGRLGAPGFKCDSPVALVKETLDWISQEWKGKLDFVIWTGDNARHNWDWREPRRKKHVMKLNQLVSEMVSDCFQGIPVIPTLGNNDVFPHNEVVENDDLLEFYERLWSAWVPTDGTFRKGGYFTVDIAPGIIRIVSLNSILFIKQNKAVTNCHRPGPAQDQLVWFKEELRRARKDKVQVIVMGHVPPSPRDYRDTCFQSYIGLGSEFSDVIISHHYGHLNMDHFLLYNTDSSSDLGRQSFESTEQKILDDDSSSYKSTSDDGITIARDIQKYVDWLFDLYESIDIDEDVLNRAPAQRNSPLVAIQVTPSVLPTYLPSVRVYKYVLPDETNPSATAVTLLGYTQYYANTTLWELSHNPDEQLEYAVEYTTEEAYGLNDLSPASLFKMAKYMVEGRKDMRTTYTRNMFLRTKNDTMSGDI